MARKNIHQSKKNKNRRPAVTVKSSQPAVASRPADAPRPVTSAPPVAMAPVRATQVKAHVAQETDAVRFAELPYELRRIALFSSAVVVLLIVLWFFLK